MALFKFNEREKEKIILKITSNNKRSIEKYLDRFAVFSVKHKFKKINLFRQLILANNIKISKFPRGKIRVVCSENDRLVDFISSKKIAAKFNGELYIHPTAGHDLPLDDPDWLANLIASF